MLDDGVCADLASIPAVGIRRMLNEVSSHCINTIAGSRSQAIRFVNGLLRYVHNSAVELIDLSAPDLHCRISKYNEVVFQLP